MVFKKISMEHASFSVETITDLQNELKTSYRESNGPFGDMMLSFSEDLGPQFLNTSVN